MRRTATHTFFFTKHDVFSNWYDQAPFVCWGQSFNCVEQAMMWAKAMRFNDTATAQRILATPDPKAQKALGRAVSPYVDAIWAAEREGLVDEALDAKFSQHPRLMQALLATQGTILVEASPYDRLWGVGLGENDPRIDDPRQWQGANKLGHLLTRRRMAYEQALEVAPSSAVETATPVVEQPVITVRTRRPKC